MMIMRGLVRSCHSALCIIDWLGRKEILLESSNHLGSTRTVNHFCVKTK